MKNQMLKFLLMAFVGFYCSLSIASTKDNNLDKLFLLSGITKQIGEFPGLVKAGFMQTAQQEPSISKEQITFILDSIDKTILPSVILDEIRASVNKSLSQEDIEILLKWYESDLGKRITTAEENSSTPEAYQRIMDSAQQLFANKKRTEAATRLDELLGTTDTLMEMQQSSNYAIFSAMMATMNPDQEPNLDECRSQALAMEPQMRESMKQLIIISFVYAYQEIDDPSLAKYEAFLKHSVTMKFNESIKNGLKIGFHKVVTNWAADLFSNLKNEADKKNPSNE